MKNKKIIRSHNEKISLVALIDDYTEKLKKYLDLSPDIAMRPLLKIF